MMDELRASAERGRQFAQWATSPGGLFEAFDATRAMMVEELLSSDPTDKEFREICFHRIKALDATRKVMEAVIADGAGSAAQIEQLTKAELKKARIA